MFGDPGDHEWPLDIVLLARDWLDAVLAVAARAGHPLAATLNATFAPFLVPAAAFDVTAATNAFKALAASGDRRRVLAASLVTASRLAVAQGHPPVEPLPFHSARYLQSLLDKSFRAAGFDVELSEIVARAQSRARAGCPTRPACATAACAPATSACSTRRPSACSTRRRSPPRATTRSSSRRGCSRSWRDGRAGVAQPSSCSDGEAAELFGQVGGLAVDLHDQRVLAVRREREAIVGVVARPPQRVAIRPDPQAGFGGRQRRQPVVADIQAVVRLEAHAQRGLDVGARPFISYCEQDHRHCANDTVTRPPSNLTICVGARDQRRYPAA